MKSKVNHRFWTVLVLAFSAFFCMPVSASEHCLNFHVINNAPLGYMNEDKRLRGVHWAYLQAIEKKSGICIEKNLTPYSRIWHSLKNGDHDGGIIFKSDSRSHLVEYAGLIRRVKTVVLPAHGVTLDKFSDLSTIIIAKTRGTHLSTRFDNEYRLKTLELNTYDQAIKMLSSGRVEAIAGSALVLGYQLQKHDALDKVDLNNRFVLGEKEQWLQISKKSNSLIHKKTLTKAIETLKTDGTFDAIMDQYYGKSWSLLNL